jgi:uncharacterized protein (DUF4415 family)
MSKVKVKARAAVVDDDNPPLDDETLARMRSAREVVPEIVKAAAKIGRPKSEHPKEAIKLRIDSDVLSHYRATGSGWQTRINDTLRRAARLRSARPQKRRARG